MSSRRRFELCIVQAIIDPVLQSENLENIGPHPVMSETVMSEVVIQYQKD